MLAFPTVFFTLAGTGNDSLNTTGGTSMNDTASTANPAAVTIDYATVKDLAVFQEHYDRLTSEIQQARVQLDSSPPLTDGSERAKKRDEWRSWLELQIRSKSRARQDLVSGLEARQIFVLDLPA